MDHAAFAKLALFAEAPLCETSIMQARTALTLAFVAACGSDPKGETPDAAPEADAPPSAPTVMLTATPSTITRPGTFTLGVMTTNHTFVDPTGQPPPTARPGEGHYHYYFDGDSASYGAGWTPTLEIETTVADPPGPHTVTVVLVSSVHVDLAPVVTATVSFTLE